MIIKVTNTEIIRAKGDPFCTLAYAIKSAFPTSKVYVSVEEPFYFIDERRFEMPPSMIQWLNTCNVWMPLPAEFEHVQVEN
jgi:hypothetical protein